MFLAQLTLVWFGFFLLLDSYNIFTGCSVFFSSINIILNYAQLPNNLKLGFLFTLLLLYFTFQLTSSLVLVFINCLFIIVLSLIYSSALLVFSESILNSLLANPLVVIHPPLYIVVFLFFSSFFLFLFLSPQFLVFRFLILYHMLFVYLFLCLFLGCWWAFQETYWGGWWFWEISELLIIFLIFLILLFLHNFNTLYNYSFFFLTLLCLAALLSYTRALEMFFKITLHSFFSFEAKFSCFYLIFIFILQSPTIFFCKFRYDFSSFSICLIFLIIPFSFILDNTFFTLLYLFFSIRNLPLLHFFFIVFYSFLLNNSFFPSFFFCYTPLPLLWFL